MIPGKKTFRPLTSSDVCAIYKLLYNERLVSFPITPTTEAKADAIVANINSSYFGVTPYPSVQEKASAYLYFIINGHPFIDGNKRTATLCFLTVCALNDIQPQFIGFSLDQVAVALEQDKGEHQSVVRATVKLLFPEK